MNRRKFLCLSGSTILGGVAGCTSAESTQTPTTGGSETSAQATTQSLTPELTPPPKEMLPQPNNGWELVEVKDVVMAIIYWGWRGVYTSPDQTIYHAIILSRSERTSDARDAAEKLADAGWQVVVVYEDVAYAAGSGTPQRTYTPEKPLVMEKTAVPDTTEEAKTLLSYSPVLTRKIIEENCVSCDK